MNRHPEGTVPTPRRRFERRTSPVTGCAVAAVVLTATAFVTPGRAVTLVDKGQARAVIVLPETPSPSQ